MAPQLAWIGLGNMGRGMVKNIVEKGNLSSPIVLYNRTASRAEELSQKLGPGKAQVATSIEEAVKSADIIFTCVADDKAITETVDSILRANVKGKLIVDCSTVHPDTTNALNKSITSAGVHFVACPVFGAPAAADAGQLIAVIAGPSEDAAKLRPFTEGVIARAIIDFIGQPPGNATLLKVIGNTFVFNMVECLSEGHTLAEKSGLGTENLHKFIELMFPGPFTAYSTRMRTGDYYNRDYPLFAVDLALKDTAHALKLGEISGGVELPAVKVARRNLETVKEHQGSKGDIAGIYGAIRQASGLKYENQ